MGEDAFLVLPTSDVSQISCLVSEDVFYVLGSFDILCRSTTLFPIREDAKAEAQVQIPMQNLRLLMCPLSYQHLADGPLMAIVMRSSTSPRNAE